MKKTKSKWFALISFISVLSLLLTACSGNSGNDKENGKSATGTQSNQLADQQVLNMVSPGDISTMNTFHATDGYSLRALEEVKSGLIRIDKNGNLIADMAQDMPKISDDKKVYTFTIRKDAKWSNGDPVTANDFVYAWQQMVSKDIAGEYSFLFSATAIKNAKEIMDPNSSLFNQIDQLGVKALDQKTLQVTLERPTPFFLGLLSFPAFFPVDQKVIEQYGDKYATEPEKMVFNGPFTLTNWDHGVGWNFVKSPDYWDSKDIHLEKVNYKIIKDVATATKLYDTGKIDFTDLSTDLIEKYDGTRDLNKGVLGKGSIFLRLNEKNPVLKNENVRDAIYNAVDRKQLTDLLLKDGSAPAYYFVAKDNMKGPDGKDFRAAYPEINKHDLTFAKDKWAQGLKEVGQDQVKLSLLISDSSANGDVAAYLKNQLEKNLKGIKVEINKQPSNEFYKLETAGQYDIALASWGPDYMDPMSDLDMWVTDGPFNNTGFNSKEYDAMIEKAQNTGADPQKRFEILQNAEKLLLDKAVIVPLYQPAYVYLLKPYVKQFSYKRPGPNQDWTYSYITKH
jgi:oligopeptide transport system substrate-binding protein